MNIFISVIALLALVSAQDIFSTELEKCDIHEDVIKDYKKDMYEITAQLYQYVGPTAINNHFAFFPLSVWITAAAIAEGLEPTSRLAMFKLLRLSNDPCIRLKYYQLATRCFATSEDVDISSTRVLVIDEKVAINATYLKFVTQKGLIDVVSATLEKDAMKAFKEIMRISSAELPNLDLSGNSVILDAVDYNGLWSTAFEDAIIEKSPFYSPTGKQIGTVDLMKIKTCARISYFPTLNIRGLELPVGKDGRYRMMFGIIQDDSAETPVNRVTGGAIINEFVNSLSGDYELVEIAIPRFTITSEYDVKGILENLGVKDLWTDSTVTGSISKPAALPSGFIHHTNFVLDKAGLEPAEFESKLSGDTLTGTNATCEKTYIANRPFLMGLFDSETSAVIMAGGFTEPTYPL